MSKPCKQCGDYNCKCNYQRNDDEVSYSNDSEDDEIGNYDEDDENQNNDDEDDDRPNSGNFLGVDFPYVPGDPFW